MPNVSILGQGQPGNVTPPMFSAGATQGGGMPPARMNQQGSGLDLPTMIALLSQMNQRPTGAPGAQPQQGGLMSLLAGLKQGGGGGTPPGSAIQAP